MDEDIEVSVVMPCLNEEETIGTCIRKAFQTLAEHNIRGEVVVGDNGSTDSSIQIAESLGARVVHQPIKGYGSALMTAIKSAKGKYIVMGDSDDSYDFSDLHRFVEPLREGKNMVMGTRLKGKIVHGAMPWLNRYIGNPFLSGFLNLLFRTGISDAHCGMRSFTREAYEKMKLQTTGMEFASEMVIKASKARLEVAEIPITLYPDGRSRKPHLRPFRDGWRHLRFMLLYSPTYLFLIPGFTMFLPGLSLLITLLFGPVHIGKMLFNVHFMFFASLLTLTGFQIISLGFYAKTYALTQRLEKDRLILFLTKHFTLERGLIVSLIFFLLGLIPNIYILYISIKTSFGPIDQIKPALFGLTFIVIGIQGIFSSFYFGVLGIGKKRSH